MTYLTQELADAISELWNQADSLHFKLKKLLKSIEEENVAGADNDDDYDAHRNLLEQLDDIKGRLDDADTSARKILDDADTSARKIQGAP